MGTIELLQKKGSVTYSAKLKGLFILPFQGQKCNKMKKVGLYKKLLWFHPFQR